MTIHVVIAVAMRLYREGLSRLLAGERDLEIADTACDPITAVERTRATQPSVVLLGMDAADALPLIAKLLQRAPACRIVALALSENEAIEYARAGVSGYVTRDGSVAQLLDAIRGAAQGDFVCSPRIAGVLVRHLGASEREPGGTAHRELSKRELQVVALIGNGSSNKEIALQLGIEVSTVKNHIHHILAKVGATGRYQAAARLRPLHIAPVHSPVGSRSDGPSPPARNR